MVSWQENSTNMTTTKSEEIPREKEPKFIGYLNPPENTIKIFRTEHYMWKSHMQIKKVRPAWGMPPVIGRWHYFYRNDRNQKISLVNVIRGIPGKYSKKVKMEPIDAIAGPFYHYFYWEICSGGTCESCVDADELFTTRKEAEVRILELLK